MHSFSSKHYKPWSDCSFRSSLIWVHSVCKRLPKCISRWKGRQHLLWIVEKGLLHFFKVRKTAKIRKRYNQVPHLTKDTTWESNKKSINITNMSQELSSFPAGDHKQGSNEQMRKLEKHKTQKMKMIHKRSTALEPSVKNIYWRA